MIALISLLYFVGSLCTALPYIESDTRNIITVPPNCPEGQVLVNGKCRDIWLAFTAAPHNIITVPNNCPEGLKYVNGKCRDIWLRTENEKYTFGETNADHDKVLKNVISTPPNCRPGQVLVNGQCHDLWRIIINDPPRSIIVVPPNCPPGQQLVNGRCREVWRSTSNILETLLRREREVDNGDPQVNNEESLLTNEDVLAKNIINIPNHCPIGFRPDALGNCRPIL